MERKLNDDAPEKNPVDSAPNMTISKSNDIMTNSAGILQSSSRKNLACPSSNSSRQVHIWCPHYKSDDIAFMLQFTARDVQHSQLFM